MSSEILIFAVYLLFVGAILGAGLRCWWKALSSHASYPRVETPISSKAQPTPWTGLIFAPHKPCPCLDSPKVAAMDPLVRAGFHNLTCSPLCRLPEELILRIMNDLGFCELACLRRASRLFLRLCSSAEFRGGHRQDDEYRHYTPWITIWADSKADEPINNGFERLKKLKLYRWRLVTCDDESHLPRHQYNGNSIDPADLRPTAYLVAATLTSPVILERKWLGHLSVGTPDGRQDGQVTADEVRSALEKLRQGAAEFIAPERAPGRLLEMRCFDPNRCRCLSLPGMDQLPSGWYLSPGGAHFDVRCRGSPGGHLGPSMQAMSGDGLVEGSRRWIAAEQHTTKQMSHTRYCLDTRTTQISLSGCISDKQCIVISYSSAIDVGHGSGAAVSRAWHEALDPGSYCLTDDSESYGVLWCWTPGCQNYYRYDGRAAHMARTDSGEYIAMGRLDDGSRDVM
ncbi:uncharacterized protein E0L32_002799 [Thyridium curvatum]|uniref:F-box domain-containing protein n=1 Tax=Thyridium curvatum TaxID=1093900 RepID=A0A507BLW5_9PEZI|nr:uncharacterized protein E0L32_002799 [Thyridium curvatum]TPX17698.1 hypothetical protein E0L32_002799 [Thyridium curvatum]